MEVAFAVGGFMLCSSLMLVVNKVCMSFVPAPSFVLVFQLGSAALVVKVLGICGFLEVDDLNSTNVKSFSIVALIFTSSLFCNMHALENVNVETFIVCRASVPLIVSLGDYAFLGRALPEPKSWAALFAILLGAVGYVTTDQVC